MQFVKNGPDIPERLLQAHEDGQVVFFCGSGISTPAGLPRFKGLVKELKDQLGESSPSIDAAIKNKQYDIAIGLFEKHIIDGRLTVRKCLASILTPNLEAKQATETHKSLLTLSKNREGRFRLVTTNCDRIFEEVISKSNKKIMTFQAPLIPIPKKRRDGLVYLHGLLDPVPDEGNLDSLILSSGDFGLAYLIERWAARFVSELFRSYTVCFVGYSVNDPILRYMVDALAADRHWGEFLPEVFAFGGHKKGKFDKVREEWEAKNITPILYHEIEEHKYLHKTLREWKKIYRDGVSGKVSIVTKYAMVKPTSMDEKIIEKVLWALSDRKGGPAKYFANMTPVPSIEWLEPLSTHRYGKNDLMLFNIKPEDFQETDISFSFINRPTPSSNYPRMALVQNNNTFFSQWDDVMHHLAYWLAKHLNEPALILWVGKQGGRLHHHFAQKIKKNLLENSLTPLMQTLWHLVLTNRLKGDREQFDLLDWHKQFKAHGLTPTLRLQLCDLLSPRVHLRKAFGSIKNNPPEPRDLVNWEIVLVTNTHHLLTEESFHDVHWQKNLPELLTDATRLLRDTLDLMRELGDANDKHDMSYLYQPSISEHPQNRNFREWTALVILVRDAWLATAKKSPALAKLEVECWLRISYPLFRRLVFFAATDFNVFKPSQSLKWLLDENAWWLWSIETGREAFRLLVALAPKLNEQDSDALHQSILKGPPRKMFRSDIKPEVFQQIMDRKIWLRLSKCFDAGAKFGPEANAKFKALSEQNPEWGLAEDQSDEFSVWMGHGKIKQDATPTAMHQNDLVAWLREHPKSDFLYYDDWKERCKQNMDEAISALTYLAQKDEWFPDRWRGAISAWSDEEYANRSWEGVAKVLAEAPDNVMKIAGNAIGFWLQAIVKTLEDNDPTFIKIVHKVLNVYRDDNIKANDGIISAAINHPVGLVIEAALQLWYKQDLKNVKELTNPFRKLFSGICISNIPIFRHGRVLLASQAILLFQVDQIWTKENLIPLFDWNKSKIEARSAWHGFLWMPRPSRPFIELIKKEFLSTAEHYSELNDHGEQYAALLTFLALDKKDTFSNTELKNAARSLPVEGLENVAQTLVHALEGADNQHQEYWKNRILPFLQHIWPKSREVKTPDISKNFAELCIASKGSFPEALQELKKWLQPLEYLGSIIRKLHTSGLCETYPDKSLELLNAVISNKAPLPENKLKDCLDIIKKNQPGIEADVRFRRLKERLQ